MGNISEHCASCRADTVQADIVDSVRRSALHSCTCFVIGQPTQCGGLRLLLLLLAGANQVE